MATNDPAAYRVSNIDYVAEKEEVTKGTPAGVPDTYIKIQDFTLKPNLNKAGDTRLAGHKAARSNLLRGLRNYTGTQDAYAEPNYMYNMLSKMFARSATTGSGPYTTTFDPLSETEPKSYTVDKAINGRVFRYSGVEAQTMPFSYEEGDNVAHNVQELMATNSFYDGKIVSVTGAEPSTIVLGTGYDPSPTALLVVGDTLSGYDKSAGTFLDLTVASVVDGTSITTTEDATSLIAGDLIYIKPQLVSEISWLAETDLFEWGQLTVKKGATLGTVASFCAEPDTTISLIHTIDEKKCAGVLYLSGLRRLTSDAEITINRVVDTGTDYAEFIDNDQVVYQFIWTAGVNSLTITFYAKVENAEITNVSNELESQTFTVKPVVDTSTGNFFTISLLNSRDTT